MALTISRLHLASRSRSAARMPEFIALMKPRVMLLAVFTALVGIVIAPIHPDLLHGCAAVLGIAAGAGAAGVLNMWYDADIDAVMARTAMRPIPRGAITRGEALSFGLVLACAAVAVLGAATNLVAAGLLAFAILFYVVAYTMWLKRRTPQNIVIGGAAGALPPVIGWAAATGNIGVEPLVLFLIIFFLDASSFLGVVAKPGVRIRPRGSSHVARRCRKGCNNSTDPGIRTSHGSDLAAAMGARVRRHYLRDRCPRQRNIFCGPCAAAAKKL